MNIIILGGGTVNNFGNDFAVQARNEGHKVIIFSHKLNESQDEDQHVIDYTNFDYTAEKFEEVISTLDEVNLIILNQNGDSYPYYFPENDIKEISYDIYHKSLNLHIVVPHLLLTKCIDKMNDGSKVVFMSSGGAFQLMRNNYFEYGGYFGIKSYMSHIVISWANTRKKKITFSILAPHFPYEDRTQYKKLFDNLYQWVLNHDDSYNGKIMGAWDCFDRMPFPLTIKCEEKRHD